MYKSANNYENTYKSAN